MLRELDAVNAQLRDAQHRLDQIRAVCDPDTRSYVDALWQLRRIREAIQP